VAVPIAIVGAGPYGLSIGAHLRSRGVRFRIFGRPMDGWIAHMPCGMALKCEGFASDLSDPGSYTLERFCADHNLEYRHFGFPIPSKSFVRYGLAFQKRLVPDVEDRKVERIDVSPCGFVLNLDDGEIMTAARVVIAVGLTFFSRIPECLASFPAAYVSHSSDHGDLSRFRGRRVVVIGSGASATDIAALLCDYGAEARLVARAPRLAWLSEALPRPWWQRLSNPHTGLGFGWHHAAYMAVPGAFWYLPGSIRMRVTTTALGPSGASHVRDRVVGRVPVLLGQSLSAAAIRNDQVELTLVGRDGVRRVETADHVIAATGYEVDLERMSLLSDGLRARLNMIGRAPELSANFESSVPGLYFTGAAAAFSFGPLMRFVVGTGFAAPRIARHLDRAFSRKGIKHSVYRASAPNTLQAGGQAAD